MSSEYNPARSASPDAEDDPDLALAIALSLQQEDTTRHNRSEASNATASPLKQPIKSTTGVTFGCLALDRKRMEEERLARLGKRSATRAELDENIKMSKSQRTDAADSQELRDAVPVLKVQEQAANALDLPFAKGVFRRTWARGYPRTGDDIKIEEVLQKEQLQLAVLSSFQWDEEWLLSKIDCRRTKMVLVAYAANDAEKAVIRSNAPAGLIRFCFPPMHGGYMHSKLQILKYEGYLRLVVPSGNLVPYDWGETGVLENMVFLIDLPRFETQQTTASTETLFGKELRRFLTALGIGEKLVKSLDNYDFSETSRYGFVHTMGRLVKDRESGTAKLSCRNWECGVLVVVGRTAGCADSGTRRGADQGAQTLKRARAQTHMGRGGNEGDEENPQHQHRRQRHQGESPGFDEVFGTAMPIPMKVPAGLYMSDESAASRPWFFMKAD
ncbi:ubiquitin interaction domain-containing protein [Colletotrichum gloeosporioides Cg-14]|uniref:Ubiquitin interaction domain-containing protein n=1 Tax=Colletotrichum gloeosporioides (strain Cg-14) TaxID=1237896 RepID=T0KCJ8_COLGC|nr:ubiquitin interaction domain-containing protein [Colletotrichum gloeosporioides Cg-14]